MPQDPRTYPPPLLPAPNRDQRYRTPTLRDAFGIEKGALLDIPTHLGELAEGVGRLGSRTWQGLSKAPVPQPPARTTPQGRSNIPLPDASAAEFVGPQLPASLPSKYLMMRSPGAGMEGWEWTAANQGASPAVKALTGFHMPTEELYKQSFRPAEQVAPGANEWAQGQLKERMGAGDFERLLGQKEQESFRAAQSRMNPTAQASLEADARRATYPARIAADASKISSLLGLQQEQEKGAASVESARARRDALGFQALQRRLDTLSEIEPADNTEQEEITEELASTKRMVDLIRSGELFLSDFLSEQAIDAIISEEGLDDLEF